MKNKRKKIQSDTMC
jgi:ferredoxin-fold anticodon binding domain-containing protein